VKKENEQLGNKGKYVLVKIYVIFSFCPRITRKKWVFQTDSWNQNGCIEDIFMLRFCEYKIEVKK